MNIFKLFSKTQSLVGSNVLNKVNLQNQIVFTLIAERKQNVPTHKNEFLPFTMNNLWDNPGAKKKKRRIGRGMGSTKGKTAGRGENGQKSRSGGGIHPRFEGGQSSIVRRIPKMGMSIRNKERLTYINMSQILYYINKGTLNPNEPINIKALHLAGVFKTAKYGIKILGRGIDQINIPLQLEVNDASESVIKAVKDNGGSVTCHYKTKLLMREAVHPDKFPFKLRDPIPSSRKVEQMERIRARGAEVVYKVPEWKQQELDQEKAELKEEEEFLKKKKEQNPEKEEFNIPFPRHHGVGKEKIRKRKPTIWRTIDYGL